MTVVIALRCDNGLILASDSQGTEAAGQVHERTRIEVEKVFTNGDRALWGAAGNGEIIRELKPKLDGVHRSIAGTTDPGGTYVPPVRSIFKKHYDRFLPIPGAPENQGHPASSLLAVGYGGDDAPYILEIDPACNATRYEEVGFHSIGSGAAFARMSQALLAHFRVKERPLSHGLLVAYRVLDAVINTSAYGVGGPIRMAQVTLENGTRVLPQGELEEIASQVGLWQELERETLETLLGETEEVEEAPLPEATTDSEEGSVQGITPDE